MASGTSTPRVARSLADPLLLIDGDLILHRNCVAVEKDVRFDDDFHVLFSNWEDAWDNVVGAITKLMDRFNSKRLLVALSGDNNFRKGIDATYKSNRTGSRKPLCFSRAKEELRAKYATYTHDLLEADDVMGIFGSRHPNSIICSADKDMKTIPSTIFDGKEVFKVSEAQADYWHMYQTLVGDTSDGYPGCPGIGPVKAAKLLDETRMTLSMWPIVRAAFEKAGLTEADALRQARLARILRDGDWNAETKEPILWLP